MTEKILFEAAFFAVPAQAIVSPVILALITPGHLPIALSRR